MSSLTDLMELAAQATDFDPLLVVENLRSSASPKDHVLADLIEGMAIRIAELETTIQIKNRVALRGGSIRPNPRKRR